MRDKGTEEDEHAIAAISGNKSNQGSLGHGALCGGEQGARGGRRYTIQDLWWRGGGSERNFRTGNSWVLGIGYPKGDSTPTGETCTDWSIRWELGGGGCIQDLNTGGTTP